jgi:hypothetical protein
MVIGFRIWVYLPTRVTGEEICLATLLTDNIPVRCNYHVVIIVHLATFCTREIVFVVTRLTDIVTITSLYSLIYVKDLPTLITGIITPVIAMVTYIYSLGVYPMSFIIIHILITTLTIRVVA